MRSFGKNYWKDDDIYENDFILSYVRTIVPLQTKMEHSLNG